MFTLLFGPMDKMSYKGFLIMWTSLFTTTLVVLSLDDSVGAPRNFCLVSQLICCTNLVSVGYGLNNKLPLSKVSLLTSGLDMCVTFTALAFLGTSVFSTTPIGIFNYVQVPIMALMGLHYFISLFTCAFNPEGYENYLKTLE